MVDQPVFDWQGHRGSRGLLPENSIPAFLKALEYPVRTLEMDVVVSKDNKIIVSHDPFFNHNICKKPDGTPVTEKEEKDIAIYNLTYEEIKYYDCGSRGNERFPEQKPTVVNKPSLQAVVESVNIYCQHNKRATPFYDIEIKSRPSWYDTLVPPPAEFVALLLEELEQWGIKEQTCIQSFDINVMKELNKQAPKVTKSFLVENLDGFDKNMALLDFTPDIYSPYYKHIDEALIQKVHARGMRLIPWTVNEVEEMEKLIELGVDGIITDYPNRIEEVRIK
jgi:glycerophosphoryl diester phosphodiesterase